MNVVEQLERTFGAWSAQREQELLRTKSLLSRVRSQAEDGPATAAVRRQLTTVKAATETYHHAMHAQLSHVGALTRVCNDIAAATESGDDDALAQAANRLEEIAEDIEGFYSSLATGTDQDVEDGAPQGPPAEAESNVRRIRIGEALRNAGVISQEQLDEALAAQERSPHRHLGDILVEKALVTREAIARLVANQLRLAYVDVSRESVEPSAVARVPRDLALSTTSLPLRITQHEIVVAIDNPLDLVSINQLERASGLRVVPVVASKDAIVSAQHRVYG